MTYVYLLLDHLFDSVLFDDLVEQFNQDGKVFIVLWFKFLFVTHTLVSPEVGVVLIHEEIVVLTQQLDPHHVWVVIRPPD